MSNESRFLIQLLDQAYDHRSWHGPNLRGSLRAVTAELAAFRPGRGRHNIWELALHAAYWKYATARRLAGDKRGHFPLKGSNFFERPQEASEAAWRKDLALLDECHRHLREVVEHLPASRLHQAPGARGSWTAAETISGVAAHDLYHAGQIQLLKRLARS
jgi:uncharacterized damage-inducible protein DinB